MCIFLGCINYILENLVTCMKMLWHGNTFYIPGTLWRKWPITSGFLSQRASNMDMTYSLMSAETNCSTNSQDASDLMPWCSCDITVMDSNLAIEFMLPCLGLRCAGIKPNQQWYHFGYLQVATLDMWNWISCCLHVISCCPRQSGIWS